MIYYCEQWTTERLECRRGKMTASHAQAIGNCWKWLDTYIEDVVADRLAIKTWITGAKNAYTDNWHELEPTARWLYELETLLSVSEIWFMDLDECTGCSPDGVIFDWDKIQWLIEIKCLDNKWHLKTLLEKKAESKYERQIQMQLLVTGAEWCDYVAYNPNFEQSLFIKRYTKDETAQEELKKWLEIGRQKIQKVESDFNSLYKN